MKPTHEIIELVKQLRKLKIKKEPEVGDWATSQAGSKNKTWLLNNDEKARRAKTGGYMPYVVIPSLEWCLGWLREKMCKPILWDDGSGKWMIDTSFSTGFPRGCRSFSADNPHLAALKAMIEVTKAEK